MYVTTKENGIINPDNYPRIDIYPDADTYALCAFTEREPDRSAPKQRITIAVYDKKVDADYALIHLYRSLNMEKRTWDSQNVPLLSDMWDEVKQKLSNDQYVSNIIQNASLNITLPDTLTIIIPYTPADEGIDDKGVDFITLETKKISNELINSLKEDSVFPIRTFTFNILTDSKTA